MTGSTAGALARHETKSLAIEAMDTAGKGLARIATLSSVDHDGDTYAPGAFAWKDGGQWAPLLTAHDRWAMPFGKTRVYEEGDAAYAELHLNLDTQTGRDWHAALKFDLDHGQPVQEWSYGYDVLDAEYEHRGRDRVRVLKRLDVQEVSTVVRGAGAGTRTLAMKAAGALRGAAFKDAQFAGLMDQLDAMNATIAADPAVLSATGRKQLGDIHAALGMVLAIPAELVGGDKNRAMVDDALASYLKLIVRPRLQR